MSSGGVGAHQLDALTTTVGLDPDGYLRGAGSIISATQAMTSAVSAFASAANAALSGVNLQGIQGLGQQVAALNQAMSQVAAPNKQAIQGMASSLRSLGNALSYFDPATVGSLGGLGANLSAFTQDLVNIANTAPNIGPYARSLGQIAKLVDASNNLRRGRMDRTATDLEAFSNRFAGFAANLTTPAVTEAAESLRKIGNMLGAVNRFKFDPQHLDNFTLSYGKLLATAGSATTDPKAIGSSLTRLASGAGKVAAMDGAKLMAGVNAIKATMLTLNSIPMSPNVQRMADAFAALGRGAGRLGGGPGKAGLPGIPPAAAAASAGLDAVKARMGALRLTALGLSSTINGVRLSLLGLAGFGLYSFAQTDDALMRAVGHMKGMGTHEPGTKEGFLAEARRLSMRSTSSVTDMAKGLDVLASSGMSAGMSIRALTVAEDFAAGGGMKLADASRRLVDVQEQLGLASTEPLRHLNGFKQTADMLARAAPQAGASVEQLASAITGRFSVAAKRMDLDAAGMVATVAVMSKVSQSFRGATGGDTAARGIGMLTTAAANQPDAWRAMGVSAIDETGKFKNFLDVLEQIGEKFADPNMAKMLAQFKESEISDDLKTVNAVELLARNAKAIKSMREELLICQGAAKAMADTVRSSLLGQLQMLWNGVTVTAQTIGEKLTPILAVVTEAILDLMRAFHEIGPAWQNVILLATGLAVSLQFVVPLLRYGFGLALSPLRAVASMMMRVTSAAAGLALWLGRAAISAATGVWDGLVWTFTKLHQLGEAVGKGIVSIVQGVIAAGRAVVEFAQTALVYMVIAAFDVAAATKEVGKAIGSLMLKGVVAAGSAFLSLASGLITALTGVLTIVGAIAAALLLLPVILPVIGFGLAVIAAPLVTLAIGAAQLAAVIGGALVAAWNAARDAASGALRWAGGKMAEVEASVIGVWQGIRETAAAIRTRLIPAMEFAAGLLWNWRENLTVTFEWLKRHGPQAFEDVGEAAFKVFAILARNAKQAALFMGDVITSTLKAAWGTVQSYASTVFDWFSGQWLNLGADVTNVFRAVTTAVAKNFEHLFDLFTRLADSFARDVQLRTVGGAFGFTEEQKKEIMGKRAESRAAALAATMDKLVGPGDFMKPMETDFGQLRSMMAFTTKMSGNYWLVAGNEIAKAFAARTKELAPLSGAFGHIANSPIWKELLDALNLTTPTAKDYLDWVKRMMIPATESKDDAGVPPAHGHSKYSFKQMSEARTLLGGEGALTLEYQQLHTMKRIEGHAANILRLMGQPPEGTPTKIKKMPTIVDSTNP